MKYKTKKFTLCRKSKPTTTDSSLLIIYLLIWPTYTVVSADQAINQEFKYFAYL